MGTTKNDTHTQRHEVRATPMVVDAQRDLRPYAPSPRDGTDLLLDSNEGAGPPRDVVQVLRYVDVDRVRRYPAKSSLEASFASGLAIDSDQVLVTAGGDEAIDRIFRAYLDGQRALVMHTPTFEMIARYARLTGAAIHSVPWMEGPLPQRRMIDAMGERAGVVALVSPNNPTGAVISADDLTTISRALPRSVILLDLAYTEFADVDLTPVALALPNVIVVRTLSKAYGLAGLRIGYAAGPSSLLTPLRAVGGPYPVSGLSLLVAEAVVNRGDRGVAAMVERTRTEREALTGALRSVGARVLPSQANFVLCRVGSTERVDILLRERGIAVRRFSGDAALADALRITLPACADDFRRLVTALQQIAAIAPEAVAFAAFDQGIEP